jgi:membrane dipeptidase
VRECEALGVIIDLAHINPAGLEEILSITTKPPIVSHTNVRRYYDIERNISDEQIRMIGERRGVIGVNSILVSPREEESTLDHYIDHIEHIAKLIGIDSVGIGF